MARHIAAKWKDYGFDQVELTRYDVLLNTPHKDLKNKVEIHRNGEVVFEAQPYEKASDTIFRQKISTVGITRTGDITC